MLPVAAPGRQSRRRRGAFELDARASSAAGTCTAAAGVVVAVRRSVGEPLGLRPLLQRRDLTLQRLGAAASAHGGGGRSRLDDQYRTRMLARPRRRASEGWESGA
eukprot:350974-Chlamydomonas_euryale.AAC.2